MRRLQYIYLSILLIVLISLDVSGQSYQLYFESANKDYLEGRYEDAIEKYHKILLDNVESGEVYFNLGNAYYKTNQYGRAILYYEKSRKYLAGDDALEKNLKLARVRIIDKIEPVPQLFLRVWWNKILNLFSIEIYAWITFIIFVFLISIIAIRFLSGRSFNRILAIISSLFIITFFIFLNKVYIFETIQFGIILSQKVAVVSEPNLTGTEVFILHEGTKVQINRTLGEWIEIKIADGKTGWLKTDTLEYI